MGTALDSIGDIDKRLDRFVETIVVLDSYIEFYFAISLMDVNWVMERVFVAVDGFNQSYNPTFKIKMIFFLISQIFQMKKNIGDKICSFPYGFFDLIKFHLNPLFENFCIQGKCGSGATFSTPFFCEFIGSTNRTNWFSPFVILHIKSSISQDLHMHIC